MIRVETIGNRTICIGGIGKMYYQEGFPIEISIQILKDKNIEVSYYHIADELLRNGFTPERVIRILRADGIELAHFCNADYETQRKMIFHFLFKNEQEAKEWLKPKLHD